MVVAMKMNNLGVYLKMWCGVYEHAEEAVSGLLEMDGPTCLNLKLNSLGHHQPAIF